MKYSNAMALENISIYRPVELLLYLISVFSYHNLISYLLTSISKASSAQMQAVSFFGMKHSRHLFHLQLFPKLDECKVKAHVAAATTPYRQ